MTSQEFGELIRTQRESKGLTIEELAARFKLSPSTLRSIEDGSLERLPHAVYARGFVRSYAQAVGVDSNDLETGIETLFPQHLFEDVPTPPSPLSSRPTKSGKSFADKLVALLIILIGLGIPIAGGWFIYTNYGDDIAEMIKKTFSAMPSSNGTEPMEATSVAEAPAAAATVTPPTATPAENQVPVPQPVAVTPQNPAYQATQPAAPVDPAPIQPAAPAQSNEEPAGVPPVDGKYVGIQGNEQCWVEVTTDGSGTRSFMVSAGETHVLPYKRKITVVLGNAGGVLMTHNNKPYPLNAKRNEKRTITLQ